jgi:Tfp pilus assembly protein PilV
VRRGSLRAVSLGEVIVALGVASVALLTLAVFLSTMHRALHEGKSEASASTIAQRVLERMRSDPGYYRAVTAQEQGFTQLFWTPGQEEAVRYTVLASATPLANARYADVTVTVRWVEERRERRVELETYLPVP